MQFNFKHIILYKKIIITALFILLSISTVLSQVHIKSTTLLEGAIFSFKPFDWKIPKPERPVFEESIFWRPKNLPNGSEKTFYHMHSIYLRDSIIGIRMYGIDFDLMNNSFRKKGPNFFRYWNTLRMGFSLMLEKNYDHPYYAKGQRYNYFNGEVYLSFLHIPHAARGDQTTRARVGSWGFFLLATPSQKYDAWLKIYPFTSTWLKFYYTRDYDINRIGTCAEIELFYMGYDKSIVHSSKDQYKGITLIGGIEYNMDSSKPLVRFGIKLDLRNH
jgi:hypothetical protein